MQNPLALYIVFFVIIAGAVAMGSSLLSEYHSEPYTTEVDGRSVTCRSLSDALALKVAEATARVGSFSPGENLPPGRLIAVSRKYGFDAIAEAIEKLR